MDYVDICCGILGCDIRSSSDFFGVGSHEAWPCHMCRMIVIFTIRSSSMPRFDGKVIYKSGICHSDL